MTAITEKCRYSCKHTRVKNWYPDENHHGVHLHLDLEHLHQNGFTSPPNAPMKEEDQTRLEEGPKPNPTTLPISKGLNESSQGKQARALWFLRSIYPVWLGIGRDSKARKFQKAPYEEPSLWYNFLSFLASPTTLSLPHPNNLQNHSFLCILQ